MKKIHKKIINFILISIMVGSLGWFLIHEIQRNTVLESFTKRELLLEREVLPGIDWETLVPGISAVVVFFLRYFLIERKKKIKLPKEYVKKEVDLEDHILFDTIQDLIENHIVHMQFGTPGRTEMFKALLCQQLETFRDRLKEFVSQTFKSKADLRKRLRNELYKIVDVCEQEWLAREIPQIVIDKYGKFFKGRIELLSSDITSLTFRENTADEALADFLNEVRTTFRMHLLRDVMSALDHLNGELDGLSYNGKKL